MESHAGNSYTSLLFSLDEPSGVPSLGLTKITGSSRSVGRMNGCGPLHEEVAANFNEADERLRVQHYPTDLALGRLSAR